jgi:hypothetical protein
MKILGLKSAFNQMQKWEDVQLIGQFENMLMMFGGIKDCSLPVPSRTKSFDCLNQPVYIDLYY